MIRLLAGLASLGWWSLLASQPVPATPACADGWTPPAGPGIEVNSVAGLEGALRSASPGDTILLADGDYALRAMLDISVPDITIRSASGDPSKVVLHGRGMVGDAVGVAISVSAPGATVADLTVRDVGYHAIQVRGERGASRFTLHNARLLDTGQQLLKGSVSANPIYADDGLVACSEFSYTTSAPSDYTNAVDLLATRGWVIRDNRFLRIRGPESQGWRSGPTILIWKASEATVVERNVIIDSFRGIAFGLEPGPAPLSRNGPHDYDHLGGVIRNNVVVNLNSWADEAIEANAARDVRIEHNTVLAESRNAPWSIGVRFPAAYAVVRNNLTNLPLQRRNGGRADTEANIFNATRSWFMDPTKQDLRLATGSSPAIDTAAAIPDVTDDFDRVPRPQGRGPDIGAFEFRPPPIVR
ncbi:MAG: choice-of-anchor Q domain-containing protein [Vicinamibacterales bacterium]